MVKLKLFITPKVFTSWSLKNDHFNYLKSKFDLKIADRDEISKEEFLYYVEDCFGILATTLDVIDEDVAKAGGSNLKVVSITASGYDRIDTKAMKAHGVRIGTSGNVVTNATAELAIALLLTVSRKIVTFCEEYRRDPIGCFTSDKITLGLEDSTIGIVGAGRIGQSIAKKLTNFSIGRLLYFGRSKKPTLEALGGKMCSLENIAKESDYIILSLALTDETYHIINERILNLMKPTAVIVNSGRGGLLDHDALLETIRTKRLAGAALDVTEPEPLPKNHPLFQQSNVVLIPHVGGNTIPVKRKMINHAVENILAVAENREMPEELII